MPVIAPWLRPTDTLGAIEGGARSGLALRQMAQQAAMEQARMQMAEQRAAQQEAQAAAALQMDYAKMTLMERMRQEDQRAKMEEAAREYELRKGNYDSMDAYRRGQLEARNRIEQAKFDKPRDFQFEGVIARAYPDGRIEEVYKAPTAAPTAGNITLPLDPTDRNSPKITTRVDSPLVNQIASPEQSRMLGTNYWRMMTNAPAVSSPVATETPSVKAGQTIKGPDGKLFKAKKDAVLPDGYTIVQ